MDYHELGRTGVKVSSVGVGTWQWGVCGWGWGHGYGRDDLAKTLDMALQRGINLIDTAEAYGSGASERLVGELTKGRRDQFFIATKLFPMHVTYDGIIKACQGSLNRLQLPYVDLYQVHFPNPIASTSTVMKAMEKLYVDGKIRAIGVSNFSKAQVVAAREALSKTDIASNQVKYNLAERAPERELLPYLKQEGITLIAYSPLAQGALTGSYDVKTKPRGGIRRRNVIFSDKNLKLLAPLIEVLRSVATAHEKAVSQVALNWLVRDPIVVAIPGGKNPKQVEDNAGAVGWSLSQEELRRIDDAYAPFAKEYRTGLGRMLLKFLSP
jgi:aryl-alcohol dehydrogenase-like predicted oxidoreductase